MPIRLSSMALLEVTGPDAAAFAQAQFSNDVPSLADGHWQWNAWLSPQGRVRFFSHLLRDDAQHLRLLLRGGDPATLRESLQRFVMRSKVQIRVADDHVYGLDRAELEADAPSGDSIATHEDASIIALSHERYIRISPHSAAGAKDDISRWVLGDIRDGFPTIAHELEDVALPQWLSLDRLGVVSVNKGCYPGQEIMSRLHFKGGNKRGLYRLAIQSETLSTPAWPIALRGESGHVGQIVMAAATDSAHCEALAILAHSAEDKSLVLDADPNAKIDLVQRFE
jgi:folate-binding protein YgfZ